MKTIMHYKPFRSLVIATLCVSIVTTPIFASAASVASIGAGCAAGAGASYATSKLTSMASSALSSAVMSKLGIGGGSSVPTSNSTLETTTDQLTNFQTITKGLEDCLVYGGGQLLLNQMTDSTLRWIKGGFNGNPLFAVDPNKLFLDLADAVTGGVARQIRGMEMCSFDGTGLQFQNDLANALELSTRTNAEAKFADQLKCPFSSVIDLRTCKYPPDLEANISKLPAEDVAYYQNIYCKRINPNQAAGEFYRDFRNGGWRAYEASLKDNGNPFGVAIKANQEIAARTTEAEKVIEKKQTNGFFDMIDENDCKYPEGMAALISSSESIDKAGSGTPTSGLMESYIPPEMRKVYKMQYCKTVTPAKVIESQLTETVGVDMKRIGFADSLSKVVSAFIQQVAKDATTGIFK